MKVELSESAKSWLDATLAFLYPPICQICRRARIDPDEGFICEPCRNGVKPLVHPFCGKCGLPYDGAITVDFRCANCHDLKLGFESAQAALLFTGVTREVLHFYKYHRAFWFEPFLGPILSDLVKAMVMKHGCNLLVPVPLHSVRLREREFNQAERLAGWVSRELGIPCRGDLLERKGSTVTQTLLKPAQRFANVRRAFAYAAREDLAGERVMLIDDVLTTGATTSACAEILYAHGAAAVHVCTVARGGF